MRNRGVALGHLGIAMVVTLTTGTVAAAKTLHVPNWSFDPLSGSAVHPLEHALGDENVASALGVDYGVVQRDRRIDSAWRSVLAQSGATILAVLPEDAVLVRVPEGRWAMLAGLPSVAWARPYRPAYKVSAGLMPLVTGEAIEHLLDDWGALRMVAVLHRGEDPLAFERLVVSMLRQAEVVGSVRPRHLGSEGAVPRLALRTAPADGAAVLVALARFEAVAYVETWGAPELLLDESVWYTQTTLPPSSAPPDGSTWRYDSTAKLFANGVTGRGQVYAAADSGIENDDCRFRYGPDILDTTQFVPLAIQAPDTVGPGHSSHRAGNKVIAYYMIDRPGCGASVPYESPVMGEFPHGTFTTGCAVGDDYFVLAAQAGVSLDDPIDDEEADARSQVYAVGIDHHQRSDGMAPAAQIVFQDYLGVNPGGTCPPLEVADIVQQAYDTVPGARVHSNAWGHPWNVTGYSADDRDLDRQSWRLRDMLVVFSAGNDGPPSTTLHDQSNFKSGLSVGATARANSGVGGLGTRDLLQSSSHGPGWPDRVKPELAVPGLVEGPRPMVIQPETGVGDGDSACGDVALAIGTSFAAPTVAGLALNVRQYFVDGFYPAGASGSAVGFVPTNALLKAVLVNSTRDLGGLYTADDGTGGASAPRPTMGQGWGHPVLDDTLFFAGDQAAPLGEGRPFLVVLNDVPNGVQDKPSDARVAEVDSFQLALQDQEVHSFSMCVDDTDSLHVTLAWSDPAGTPASGGGVHPLRNDLDLELVDPLGNVWRPNPRTAVWSAGGSVLCPPGQDSTGLGPDRRNANWDPSLGDTSVIDEDFADADRSNPIENIFIDRSNPDLVGGEWILNVMGIDVQGNGEPPTLASPSFIDSDGDLEYDTILDTDQGYALIASGNVTTARGVVHFDRARYECGDMARVIVRDCDGTLTSPSEVTVTTSLGDCEVFALGGVSPVLATLPFIVVDAEAGTPGTCAGVGDGIVVVGDDGSIHVRYMDTSPAARDATASAGVSCRDVRFVGVTFGMPCEAGMGGAAVLRRNEPLDLVITLENASPIPVDSLWCRMVPLDDNVMILDGGAVIEALPSGPGPQVSVPVSLFVGPAQPCPSTLRFRVEVHGTRGFRDRLYFELPLNDCAIGTIGTNGWPDEVPSVDTPGVSQAVRVRKAGPLEVDLRLSWDRAARAQRYRIWRGSIAQLRRSGYTHAVPLGGAGAQCNIPEMDPSNNPGVLNGWVLFGEAASTAPLPHATGTVYYLITANADCPSGLASLDGPGGYADTDRDGVFDDEERRPGGLLLDPGCLP